MRRIQRVVVMIGVGCVGLLGLPGLNRAGSKIALAKGGMGAPPVAPVPAAPVKVATLAEALVAAVKALTDTNPTPVEAVNLNSSKSNRIAAIASLIANPVLCATSVKSGKSNSSERIKPGAPPVLKATYLKAAAASQPLLQVAKGTLDEAPVGTITTDRALMWMTVRLVGGTYVTELRKGSTGRGGPATTVVVLGPDGAAVGGIDVNSAALVAQLVTPPAQQQYAEIWANAVILNLVVSMLEEDKAGGGGSLGVRAEGTGMEPMDGTLAKLHIGWDGGGLDFVPGGSVVVGREKLSVADIASVRIAWADGSAGRIPSATIVTKAGKEIPITTGRGGPITAIDFSVTSAAGAAVALNWQPGAATDRTSRRPTELTVVKFTP